MRANSSSPSFALLFLNGGGLDRVKVIIERTFRFGCQWRGKLCSESKQRFVAADQRLAVLREAFEHAHGHAGANHIGAVSVVINGSTEVFVLVEFLIEPV